MNNNNLASSRNCLKLPQYLCVAAICLLAGSNISVAEKRASQAELNRLLISVANKEPTLFGSDALCERDKNFWNAVEKSSLLAVLQQQEGFREIPLDPDHTVWFVPISACFSGNKASFIMLVRSGNEFRSIETPITGVIENVRFENDKIVFEVTSYGGLFEAYHYLYSYDGRQLTEELMEREQQ